MQDKSEAAWLLLNRFNFIDYHNWDVNLFSIMRRGNDEFLIKPMAYKIVKS